MANNVTWGGAIGAAVGACAVPFLGPAAIPGFAAVGTRIGWWAANAEIVRDVADGGIDIAGERSKDCTEIFQNAIESMLQKGGELLSGWSEEAKSAANVTRY